MFTEIAERTRQSLRDGLSRSLTTAGFMVVAMLGIVGLIAAMMLLGG
jgi:hypothetical protein